MRVSRNFKLGILVVLSFLLLFIGFNFLKSFGTFGKVREFTVEFNESSGLQVGDEVQLAGVQVGTVKELDLHPENANKIVVKFSIDDDDIQLPKESELWLISSDILGTKILDLRIPPDSLLSSPNDYYEDGDHFDPEKVNVAMNLNSELEALFLPIKDKTKDLIKRVEDIILSVNVFWDTSAAYTYDASMYDVNDAVDKFTEMTNNLTDLVRTEKRQVSQINSDINNFQGLLSKDSMLLVDISTNFNEFTQTLGDTGLAKTLDETSEIFKLMDERFKWVNKGNGTVGLLGTDSLKNEITKIDTALKSLQWHLEDRPKDFVGFSIFGLKALGYKPKKSQKKYLDETLDSLEDRKKIDYE